MSKDNSLFPLFSIFNDFESQSFHVPEIKSQHRSLYYFFIGVVLHRRGANRFPMAIEYGMMGAKIGNKKTYLDTLRDLQDAKFITYTPGKNRFTTPIIEVHFRKPTASLLHSYRSSIGASNGSSTVPNIKAIDAIDANDALKVNLELESKTMFEKFRKEYPGKKRGLETEYPIFTKHKDYQEVAPLLMPSLMAEIKEKAALKKKGSFVPEWPMLSTYLNQRRWELYGEKRENEPTRKVIGFVPTYDRDSYRDGALEIISKRWIFEGDEPHYLMIAATQEDYLAEIDYATAR